MANIKSSPNGSPPPAPRVMRKNIDAFHSHVWPILTELGWTKIDAAESLDGKTTFVAPVLQLKVGELGVDFWNEEKGVIDRLLERRNEGESRAADIYLACVSGPPTPVFRAKKEEKTKSKSPPKSRTQSANQLNQEYAGANSMDVGASPTSPGLNGPVPMHLDDGLVALHAPKNLQLTKTEQPNPHSQASSKISGESAEPSQPQPRDQQSVQKEECRSKTEAKIEAETTKPSLKTDMDAESFENVITDMHVCEQASVEQTVSKIKDSSALDDHGEDATASADCTKPRKLVSAISIETQQHDDKQEDLAARRNQPSPVNTEVDPIEYQATADSNTYKTSGGDKHPAKKKVLKFGESNRVTEILSGFTSSVDSNSASIDKQDKEDTISESLEERNRGRRNRRRATNRATAKVVYNEDELDAMIGDEEENGQNETKSTTGAGHDFEICEESGKQKRRRRKRKPATATSTATATANEPPPKKRGRGRPKRNAPKRAEPPPPRRGRKPARQHSVAMVDLSWKNGGKNFPKKVSQVGPEFNATEVPETGTWQEKDSFNYYEQVWDPKTAEEKLQAVSRDFLAEKKVPHNKREAAMVGLAEVGYDAGKFAKDNIVGKIETRDGSEWTDDERRQFHKEMFRLRKDILGVSKSIGKNMNSCLAYYLGTYKKTTDYRIMKSVHYQERERRQMEAENDVDACCICGDGGNLLICDGCEGEFHMECMRPALYGIPEGIWKCDECVDIAFLAAKDSLLRNDKLFERVAAFDSKRKKDKDASKDENADGTLFRLQPVGSVLDIVSKMAQHINAAFLEAAVDSVPAETSQQDATSTEKAASNSDTETFNKLEAPELKFTNDSGESASNLPTEKCLSSLFADEESGESKAKEPAAKSDETTKQKAAILPGAVKEIEPPVAPEPTAIAKAETGVSQPKRAASTEVDMNAKQAASSQAGVSEPEKNELLQQRTIAQPPTREQASTQQHVSETKELMPLPDEKEKITEPLPETLDVIMMTEEADSPEKQLSEPKEVPRETFDDTMESETSTNTTTRHKQQPLQESDASMIDAEEDFTNHQHAGVGLEGITNGN